MDWENAIRRRIATVANTRGEMTIGTFGPEGMGRSGARVGQYERRGRGGAEEGAGVEGSGNEGDAQEQELHGQRLHSRRRRRPPPPHLTAASVSLALQLSRYILLQIDGTDASDFL